MAFITAPTTTKRHHNNVYVHTRQGSHAGYEHSSKMKKTKNKKKKKKTLHFDVHVHQEDVVWQFIQVS